MIYDAETFAKGQHHGQKYDDKDYDYHLDQVVAVVKAFSSESHIVDAAWLHDIIEDTEITYFDVARKFGTSTANMVWACTGVGSNRKERVASIAAKLPIFPGAPIVKTADRIANLEYGLATKNYSKWSMYMKEQSAFINVVKSYVPEGMIWRLDTARATGLELFNDKIKV